MTVALRVNFSHNLNVQNINLGKLIKHSLFCICLVLYNCAGGVVAYQKFNSTIGLHCRNAKKKKMLLLTWT